MSPMASKTFRSVCAHDCPDACSVLVTVEGGRATQFRGDPDHPFTRGFLCGKVNAYEKVVHSPERILSPMRRVGKKGEGRFERTSWDEAVRLIASKITTARDRWGGEALLQYYYAGTMGYVHRYSGDALFNRLGASTLRQNICYFGAEAGYEAVVGGGYGLDPEDVVHADLILVWGCNVVTTQVHLVPFIDEARKRGARLVVIDPYRTRTAQIADHHLKPRPGSDPALALALIHVLERDGLIDRSFIERRTSGWERLSAEVLPQYSPERTEELTGIPRLEIEQLAHAIGRAQAPVAKVGIGIGRSLNGGASMQAICCLMGAVGAYDKRGGGVLYDAGCEFKVNLAPIRRPDWLTSPTRVVNQTELAHALTKLANPPVTFLYVHGANPAATVPEQALLEEGLRRDDLFTVVHERFPNDTVRFADVVLPAPTFVETDDLFKSYGHLYLQYARRVIEPLGECRANLDVFQAIGRALGFHDPWFSKSVEELAREALTTTEHPNFQGLDVERILQGETTRLNIPRGLSCYHERFRTRSGKLEFDSELLRAQGLPSLPGWRGDPTNSDPARYPLRLLTPPGHHFLNASFGSNPDSVKRMGGEPRVFVHPDDARRYGVDDGGEVELSNDLGAARLLSRVTEETQPGVVIAEGTWWPWHSRSGRGINALTSSRLTDIGGGSTFHDNYVAIRRVGG